MTLFSIYRFFGDENNEPKTVFENLKTKMKFQGTIGGLVEYEYHIPSGRYYAKGTQVPTFNLIETGVKEVIEEPEYKIKPVTPQDAFGEPYNNESDVPF